MKKARVKDFVKNPIGGHKTRKYLNYSEVSKNLLNVNRLFLSGHGVIIFLVLSAIGTVRRGQT
jgi:hypothetical protein